MKIFHLKEMRFILISFFFLFSFVSFAQKLHFNPPAYMVDSTTDSLKTVTIRVYEAITANDTIVFYVISPFFEGERIPEHYLKRRKVQFYAFSITTEKMIKSGKLTPAFYYKNFIEW